MTLSLLAVADPLLHQTLNLSASPPVSVMTVAVEFVMFIRWCWGKLVKYFLILGWGLNIVLYFI